MRITGIDLARKRDYTAIVAVNAHTARIELLGAQRLERMVPWNVILQRLAWSAQLADITLIDASGIGDNAVEQLRDLVPECPIVPVVFTGGRSVSMRGDYLHIAKHELVKALQRLITSGRFRVPAHAPGRDLLHNELVAFQAITTRNGWRYSGKTCGGHDDLVMALALCAVGVGYVDRLQEKRMS
jgi:hypothetical protein